MNHYLQLLEKLKYLSNREDDEMLQEKELTLCRGVIGQLIWLSKSRLDIAYLVNKAAQNVLRVKGAGLANKVIRHLEKVEEVHGPCPIIYRKLSSLAEDSDQVFNLVAFADANFSPEDEGRSNYGNIFFLCPPTNNLLDHPMPANLLKFSAKLQKRRSKNPKIAELQSVSQAHSDGLELVQQLEEIGISCKFTLLTDNESVFKNVYSNNPVLSENRYMPHLHALRETFNPRINSTSVHRLLWIPGANNIADGLTKHKTPGLKLIFKYLESFKIDLTQAIYPSFHNKAFLSWLNSPKDTGDNEQTSLFSYLKTRILSFRKGNLS